MNEINAKSFTCFEYATETKKEYEYLLTVGIRPTFIKKNQDTGIKIYKYKKTTELFLALAKYFLDKEKEYSSTLVIKHESDSNA